MFGGDVGDLDDRVVAKMHETYLGDTVPIYLDAAATDLLAEARQNFKRMGLRERRTIAVSDHSWIIAIRKGTVKTATLALALRSFSMIVQTHDGFVEVQTGRDGPTLEEAIRDISVNQERELFSAGTNLIFEKFHPYLSDELLRLDALTTKLDMASLVPMALELLGELEPR